MLFTECPVQLQQPRRPVVAKRGQFHGQFESLANVTHLHPRFGFEGDGLKACSTYTLPRLRFEFFDLRSDLVARQTPGAPQERLLGMELEPGLQQTDGREDSGSSRHDYALDTEFPSDSHGMDGSAASERDQREVAWIPAALDRDGLDRPDHAGVGDTLDCGEFIRELAATCRDAGVLLLFDEVITGFRLAYGGAQEEFGVMPDLAAYGKALGGGLPIGAVAGRADIMQRFEWQKHHEQDDRVFAGGTFGGNPLTMVAGTAAIGHLRSNPGLYERLAGHWRSLVDEVGGFCRTRSIPVQVLAAHSMIHLRFQMGPIVTARDVDRSLAQAEREFYIRLMLEGVLIPGDHLALTSTAHGNEDIARVIEAVKKALLVTEGLNGPR